LEHQSRNGVVLECLSTGQGRPESNHRCAAYRNAQSTRGVAYALVITAENDVLRDEGEAYARKLWEAGVRVTCTRYVGTIHDFVMLNDIADAPAARSAIAQANNALISALQ
jgi:acetyl esterase